MSVAHREPQFADCLNWAFAGFRVGQIGRNCMRSLYIVYGIAYRAFNELSKEKCIQKYKIVFEKH
jgi:hypothetical protein